MVFADSIHRSTIDKKFQEHVEIQLINSLLIILDIFLESDFILHVFYLFLRGIKTHTSHHVCDGFQWHFTIQFPGLSCMFIFGSDLTVVEEILKITHHLASGSSFKQLRVRILLGIIIKTLGQSGEINFPHIHTKIISS